MRFSTCNVSISSLNIVYIAINHHLHIEQLAQQGRSATTNAVAGPSLATHATTPKIPKPKGSAGGGRRGFHLQDEMGLGDDDNGQHEYNMMLVSIK